MDEIAMMEIWDVARTDAKEKYLNSLVGGVVDEELVSSNPYEVGTEEHSEYEAAFEHYAMSLLGY